MCFAVFLLKQVNCTFHEALSFGSDMERIESILEDVVRGEAVNDDGAGCVDYSIQDQLAELATKGVESQCTADFRPVLMKNVTYIAGAVVFNDKGEVLLMQEAKVSCAGTWYLPAGRVEPGEQIIEAVRREVFEETGLDFHPQSLLCVETAKGSWYRFIFTGEIIGGKLKTVAEADAESLQAAWVSNISSLSLRGKDIINVIDRARQYFSDLRRVNFSLPAVKSHCKLYLRIVCIIKKKLNNRVHVLVSEKGYPHVPLTEINPMRSVHTALKRFMNHVFINDPPPHKPHGVLSVEHDGTPIHANDGLCLSVLVSCKNCLEEVSLCPSYTWLEISTQLADQLQAKIKPHTLTALTV
ncbi:8-oxo-dGDP phosphatase NUDT18-like [Varroa destructor]|uniref:Nudix hydrolase domain-containing protein n=1 Tax=Varroa destructor TaxID=109461 RepID=A0A7M7JED3_VARDE|nr:8-oxo-dGDP phosphatase NUDT18-like [Varroa destructor]